MRAAKPSRMHPASMSRSGTAVASAEALDNGEDPQRASLVETRHRRLAREFEHGVEDPSQGAAIRRTCYDRSKFGSTSQRGVDRRKGTSTSRCRNGEACGWHVQGGPAVSRRWSIKDENRSHRLPQQGPFSIPRSTDSMSPACNGLCDACRRMSTVVMVSSVAVLTDAIRVPGVCATRSQRGAPRSRNSATQSRRGTGGCLRFGRRRRI
jgi:hypothetical protein